MCKIYDTVEDLLFDIRRYPLGPGGVFFNRSYVNKLSVLVSVGEGSLKLMGGQGRQSEAVLGVGGLSYGALRDNLW